MYSPSLGPLLQCIAQHCTTIYSLLTPWHSREITSLQHILPSSITRLQVTLTRWHTPSHFTALRGHQPAVHFTAFNILSSAQSHPDTSSPCHAPKVGTNSSSTAPEVGPELAEGLASRTPEHVTLRDRLPAVSQIASILRSVECLEHTGTCVSTPIRGVAGALGVWSIQAPVYLHLRGLSTATSRPIASELSIGHPPHPFILWVDSERDAVGYQPVLPYDSRRYHLHNNDFFTGFRV